jgi:hypothetical protein
MISKLLQAPLPTAGSSQALADNRKCRAWPSSCSKLCRTLNALLPPPLLLLLLLPDSMLLPLPPLLMLVPLLLLPKLAVLPSPLLTEQKDAGNMTATVVVWRPSPRSDPGSALWVESLGATGTAADCTAVAAAVAAAAGAPGDTMWVAGMPWYVSSNITQMVPLV